MARAEDKVRERERAGSTERGVRSKEFEKQGAGR
jgi:hypothetical protein